MPALTIAKAVGRNAPNLPADVQAVAAALAAVGKLPPGYRPPGGQPDAVFLKGITDTQRHWMAMPDGVMSVGGRTQRFLQMWKPRPVATGVQLTGRLQEAWNWVSPLLPEGSYCSSGYRSADAQRKILHAFFTTTFRAPIIAKYTQAKYDEVAVDLRKNEQKVLEMVRGVGQAVAAPGRSAHQLGKAVDIGGPPAIDNRQVEMVTLVARAHPQLFSGKVLKERNGCVHFEIR